jgi:hypothetical protein
MVKMAKLVSCFVIADFETWTTITSNIKKLSGKLTIYILSLKEKIGNLFNFNWWQFHK